MQGYQENSYSDSAKRIAVAETRVQRRRLELRTAPFAKRVIYEATPVTGLAAGDLAVEGARQPRHEHRRMMLQGTDRDVFLATISREPNPARGLVDALKRHHRQFG